VGICISTVTITHLTVANAEIYAPSSTSRVLSRR